MLAAALGLSSGAEAAIAFRTVALSGATGAAAGFGPNLGAGVTFTTLGELSNTPVVNDAGHVAFFGSMTGGSVTPSTGGAFFLNSSGPTTAIARTGGASPTPDLDPGIVLNGYYPTYGLTNADGLVFDGLVTGPGMDPAKKYATFICSGGQVTTIARSGTLDHGPNLGPDVTFDHFAYGCVANASGNTAFFSVLAGTAYSVPTGSVSSIRPARSSRFSHAPARRARVPTSDRTFTSAASARQPTTRLAL